MFEYQEFVQQQSNLSNKKSGYFHFRILVETVKAIQ